MSVVTKFCEHDYYTPAELAEQIDETMAKSIGSDRQADGFRPVDIDETKRRTLSQALLAIAWAVQN